MNDEGKRIRRARARLISRSPAYARLTLGCTLAESTDVPTMGTDGSAIWYNPSFTRQLSPKQLLTGLAHEGGHKMLLHPYRLNGRDQLLWNQAGDYVINLPLSKDPNIFEPIPGWLCDAVYDGMHSDGVYAKLRRDGGWRGRSGRFNPDGNGCGGLRAPMGANGKPAQGAELAELADAAKAAVHQAAMAERACGGPCAEALSRVLGESTKAAPNPWEQLAHLASAPARIESSWRRPNRRFVGQGIYLPSLGGYSLGPIVLAFDSSGSISQDEMRLYFAQSMAILDRYSPAEVHALSCDTKVQSFQSWDGNVDLDEFDPEGGGGTRFSPAFAAIAARLHEDPDVLIYFTDLECRDFPGDPGYPVIWVSTNSRRDGGQTPPFGDVIWLGP